MRSFLWQSILLGFAATSTAVYKGNVATDGEAVGVVRVQVGGDENNFGSGVVLGNGKCVITAAHVVKGFQPGSLKVFKNEKKGNKIVRTRNSVAASSINVHPDYKGNTDPEDQEAYAFDFAVVELASKMDTSPWKISQTRGYNEDVILYGWGSTSRSPATYPPELRSGLNKIPPIETWGACSRWRNIVGAICMANRSSSPENGRSEGLNCGGDSGGPVVAKGYVIGVASEIDGICGYQTAGLLAGLSGSKQEAFLRSWESKCGFKFGSP